MEESPPSPPHILVLSMASSHRKYPYGQFGSGIGSDFFTHSHPTPWGEGDRVGKRTAKTLCKHCLLMDIILVVSTVLVTNLNHITGAAMLNIYSISPAANTSCAVYLPQASSFPLMVKGCFSWLPHIHVISNTESWRAFPSMHLLCEFHLCQKWFPRYSGEKLYWNNFKSVSLPCNSKRLVSPHHPLLFSESWIHWGCGEYDGI